ncbi:MAG TPA: C39 family peptidase [Myxococcales bacterium]
MVRRIFVAAAVLGLVLFASPSIAAERFPVRGASGVVHAEVDIENLNLDEVLVSESPAGGEAVAVIRHGREGGASLVLASGGKVTLLDRALAPQSYTAPAFSPDGSRFAVVRALASTWTSETVPRLQSHGALLVGSRSGELRAASVERDAARVLGWLDARTLVFTRYLVGDLPEERPFSIDLPTGRVAALTDGTTAHAFAFTLAGGRLYFSRSAQPIVTAPGDDERVELVQREPISGAERVLAVEVGALPSEFALEPASGRLAYALDGMYVAKTVDLGTGATTTRKLQPPGIDPALRSPSPGGDLAMPYVHQVYDTPDDFNGNWACGPTSTIMCVQHFNRLGKWPITASWPSPHTSDYGAYDAYEYSAYGSTFNRVQNDASGRAAKGAYGWCTDGGGAWAWRMQDYAKRHDLNSDFDGTATFAKMQASIDAGKAVALSTQLTSAGHLVTIKGYTSDGRLVVNDPYGNKNLGYKNYQGENSIYTWSQISAKWFITVHGTVTQTNKPPTGWLDSVTCDAVGGWSQDPDEPGKAIDVHVYFGGPAGSGATGVPVNAGIDRSDLCGAIGSCNHGFSLLSPLSLHDGAAHAIHAYGIDSQGGANPQLSGSPGSMQCDATPPAGVKRHVTDPSVYGAWKFDAFRDQMKIADAVLDAMPTEKDIAPSPVMIRADGAPEVYLIDQGYRRHVPSPAVAANWRLDLGTVLVKPAAEVDPIPLALPIRSRPVLVIGSGPAVYVVDDALPVPPGPDAGAPGPDASAAGPDAGRPRADASTVAPGPDASVAIVGDGGTALRDAGTSALADGSTQPGITEVSAGCGCGAATGAAGGLPLLGLLAAAAFGLARRRR